MNVHLDLAVHLQCRCVCIIERCRQNNNDVATLSRPACARSNVVLDSASFDRTFDGTGHKSYIKAVGPCIEHAEINDKLMHA